MLNLQSKSNRSESQSKAAARKLRRARAQLDEARKEAGRSVEHARNAAAATRDAVGSGASAAVRRADSRVAGVQEQARDATKRLEARAKDARDRASQAGRAMLESGQGALDDTRRRIEARPLTAALSTAAIGLAAGWLLGRRTATAPHAARPEAVRSSQPSGHAEGTAR